MHSYMKKRKSRPARFIVFLFTLILISVTLIGFTANKEEKSRALSAIPTAIPSKQQDLEEQPERVYKIVIDAGHGGKDPGAEGASGQREKHFTLSLSQKVYELLKQENMFEPHLTRTDDTFIELDERPDIANQMKADVFLSIHANTFKDKNVGGIETFYRFDENIELAQTMHNQVVKAMGFRDRGIRFEELKVLSLSKVPAILLEVGYLTNPAEEAVLLGEDGQDRAAQAIVDGLKQYFENNPEEAIIQS
jgi:N-acetylmuramoyl-L-alanine amidase